MKICVIGLGLIGGSMAIDLKKRGFCSHVIGVDINPDNAVKALKLGFIDEISKLDSAIQKSDVIILAIPTDESLKLLPQILDRTTHQIVTDVCSTKESICEVVNSHPKREQFVAGHPMAGTEYSGPDAAISGLFDGKATILCEMEKNSREARSKIRLLYQTLNMRMITMDAASHDVHAAYVSHISHISSFALALTVLEKEENERNIFDLASGGFDSTVRLAKSSASMWAPILSDNSENITQVLETYINRLQDFKEAISQKKTSAIKKQIKEANKIRKVLANPDETPEQVLPKPVLNKLKNN